MTVYDGSLASSPTLCSSSFAYLQDAVLSNQSASSMRHVFAPKVATALQLERYMSGHRIQQMAVFSSIASLLGSSGQINYAAANCSLDCWSSSLQSQVSPCYLDWLFCAHLTKTFAGLSLDFKHLIMCNIDLRQHTGGRRTRTLCSDFPENSTVESGNSDCHQFHESTVDVTESEHLGSRHLKLKCMLKSHLLRSTLLLKGSKDVSNSKTDRQPPLACSHLAHVNLQCLQGLAVHSMQWGAWGGGGMASNSVMKARLERVGMGLVPPVTGLHSLQTILNGLAMPGELFMSLPTFSV